MIYHWCPSSEWEAAGDTYVSPSLDEEGFIHFSHRHQVARTATGIDRGRQGLVLLCVDETQVAVVDEDCYELGEEYPHVYAPIPTTAVVAVLPFPPRPDGSFEMPEEAP